jgi:hypothetical protein
MKKPRLARPTGETFDAKVAFERAMTLFPTVMARLHQSELEENPE